MIPIAFRQATAALASSLVLAACGGGGDPPRQEGFWVGATSNGMTGAMVILSDGALLAAVTAPFDLTNDQTPKAARSYQGALRFDGGTFSGTASYVTYDDNGNERGSAAATGTITGNARVNAKLPDGTTFEGQFRDGFDTPAAVGGFAGTYRGRVLEASNGDSASPDSQVTYPGTVTVDADGMVRHDAGRCATTGRLETLTPARRAAHIELTGAGVCFDPTRRSGLVVLDTAVSPPRLYILTTHDDKVGGFQFTGIRTE